MTWDLYHGDCLEGMASLDENSVDAIVTDPPYFLGFMGKEWDGVGSEGADFYQFSLVWSKQAMRVLKPGGHVVAFASSRTYHRMACGIEDAGFEVRDQLMWLYGSGFPKSLNVSKALGVGAPEGVGTALKPAHEPILLARKPLSENTVAANVLKWGTGGLNVDGTRIEYRSESDRLSATPQGRCTSKESAAIGAEPDAGRGLNRVSFDRPELKGRFPANLLLDEEAAAQLDAQTGILTSGIMKAGQQRKKSKGAGGYHNGMPDEASAVGTYGDSGGASRFFYCSKASKADRCGSTHPTVKPIALMRWLVRLITPPGGIVLDPFAGTGTTGQAAVEEGRNALLMEKEDQSIADIERRMALP